MALVLFLLIAGEIENGVASVRPSLRATLSAADNSKRVSAVTVSGHEILMRIINVTALTERAARAGWFCRGTCGRALSPPQATFTEFPATFFPSPIVRSSIYNVYTLRQFLLRFYLRSFYYF